MMNPSAAVNPNLAAEGVDPRASVLLVDDDPHNLFALEQALGGLDIDCVKAPSGEEALRHLLRRDFALILLDVNLPGLDGYEVARLVRQRERNRHVPIIFLSGVSKDDKHLFRGYSAGAVDYVLKPVDPMVLRSKVAVFVDLHNKSRELQRQVVLKQRLLDDNIRAHAERLAAEHALRAVEERQSTILKVLPIAVYSIDLSSGLAAGPQFVGDMVERMTGVPASRFQDDPHLWEDRIHPEDRERVRTEKAEALSREAFMTEYRWQAADGSYRHVLDQGVLARAPDGRQEIVGTWLDVTERRLAEQQLAQVQKIDALGQLTGGIAHDFNNMLMVVINNLDRVIKAATDGEPKMKTRLEMAMQGALRCSDLTRQLLTFARRQTLQASPIDLNTLVRDMLQMLRRTLEDEVDIDITLAEGIGTVVVDRAQVESVILNLVVNARDAMAGGGTIRIGTADVTVPEGGRPEFPDAVPGDYVMLTVADSGSGMTPDVLARVFEPFFTTKEVGRGTGLGLSIIYGFVKQSGGFIAIRSEPGRGTTVCILLPRSTEEVPRLQRRDDDGEDCPRAQPGETVLLVEDDASVRAVVVEEVRDLGYEVLEAADARTALDVLAGREGGIGLLFTDIAMPGGMNGYALAAAATDRLPELKVLYTSAHPEFTLSRTSQMPVQAPLLQKPYFRHELAKALRAILDKPVATAAAA